MTITNEILDYTKIFETRGSSYHQAMSLFPNARKEEFEQLILGATLTDHCIVADVPAGGGYLKKYLPESVIYQGHEPCASFSNHSNAYSNTQNLLPLPWQDKSIDCTFSLAGVHHLKDKASLFREIYRTTKPKGMFVLFDVEEGSKTANFLDNFVGCYNSTGHVGLYLNQNTVNELENSGWSVILKKRVRFHWVFDNTDQLALFCQLLFDLKNINTVNIIKNIKSCMKVNSLPSGQIGMEWSLLSITSVIN